MTISNRPPINSARLRQNYPALYQELFSSCQVVVSAADSFFWSGEYARSFGGLTIQQKLPTKTILGLEFLNEKKFCFADLSSFNPTKMAFEQRSFGFVKETRLINFLKEYWPTLDPQGRIKGFRIHVISESRCGDGLGKTGLLVSCLSACMLLAANRVSTDEINNWSNATVDQLLNDKKYSSFSTIFRLAWRLGAINRNGNAAGSTSFCALLKTQYPILFISKNINDYLAHPSVASPKTTLENCEVINEIPFWGSRLEEIFPLRLPQPWPINIARVFSGTTINSENIFKSLSKLKSDIETLQNVVADEIAPHVHTDEPSILSLFDPAETSEKKNQFSYSNYIDIFNIASIELLFAFRNLFQFGSNEDSLRKFVNVIHQIQDFNHFLGHSTPPIDELCARFSQIIASDNEFHLGSAKIDGIGKSGHIVCAGPAEMIPDHLTQEAARVSEQTGKDIFVDWLSSVDGFGEDGLTVEQFIPKSIYSSYVSPQCHRLTLFHNAIPEVKIVEPNIVHDLIKEYDIALLVPEHKILIRGKSLTSKDIPSTKATIEILSKILSSADFKIANSLFSDSSYGQSRYELQSKIIIPLNKVFYKIAGKKLDFQIHGGMYDDYSVSLNAKNLKIALIDSVG